MKKLMIGALVLMSAGILAFSANVQANQEEARAVRNTPIYEPCYNPNRMVVLFCAPGGTRSCFRETCYLWP
ncbi:hypothetical protein SCOR_01990 [Sulfidibacter corallicola]|uniref:Uncharacterized protein n=1 Tax=Sulfidibacter corallicola TaxID=2818388 RepID=A0A8A4TGR1_SULCO|nr:hypothetical protein [Sulfidibacter corallicola]QTD48707.1 hypothetical protein J3U87_24260 [Sulfidibacter corallicola]